MHNPQTNFMTHAPADIKRPRFGRRKWPYVLAFIVIIIVLLGLLSIPYIGLAQSAYSEALAGKQDLEEAQKLAIALKLEQAEEYVESAIEHFEQADSDLTAFKIFTWVPWLGTQIRAVDNILTTSLETSRAISNILGLAQDIFEVFEYSKELTGELMPEMGEDVSFADLNREQKREILKSLHESVPRLEEAKIKIDLAMQSFQEIPRTELAEPLREAIEPFAQYLPEFKKQIDFAIPLFKIVPHFAGYPESKNYLVLFSNNTELRPSGGFLGTYGLLKVADGEIISFNTHDIYAIDGPAESFLRVAPPPPLVKYLKADAWFMRDSNWSPDFPTSAEKALWFYSEEARGIVQERGAPIEAAPLVNFNGVVSINPDVVAELLGVTGPIT
ncbi:DUF4012 domain-containing protein, partial [Patescibacteria group bacterium]|nr:DUF4012 domain-containing protein [Patescibacteria group bacterium]MBU1922493.1 DUF4012 domain-containing protein [Patescibacteria group bacterium]